MAVSSNTQKRIERFSPVHFTLTQPLVGILAWFIVYWSYAYFTYTTPGGNTQKRIESLA